MIAILLCLVFLASLALSVKYIAKDAKLKATRLESHHLTTGHPVLVNH
jgi:hypothetical protein